ncbi:hypothetical protein OIU78_028318 [Salix suchowensis]|nr:hypothetical protein OIU78_028318 [Salix suchowensis]
MFSRIKSSALTYFVYFLMKITKFHILDFQRNLPKIIEALSVDGSGGQHIETSTVDALLGKSWVSPSERYAIVPDESGHTVSGGGNGNDASVPESDVKRIRI